MPLKWKINWAFIIRNETQNIENQNFRKITPNKNVRNPVPGLSFIFPLTIRMKGKTP
jgi:hypothetical protein